MRRRYFGYACRNKIQGKERHRSMIRKEMIGRMILLSLMIGLTGCGKEQDNKTEEITAATAATETDATETDAAEQEDNSDYVTGQGFRPPAGSHTDSNGNIVDQEGNTYDKEGKWQIPEGGRVDSQGHIYDKYGRLMGGGATIGSQG